MDNISISMADDEKVSPNPDKAEVSVSHTAPVSYKTILKSPQSDFVIKLDNVSKLLSGKRVLDGVTLEVKRGEILTIIGGSGAGKSVTIKHIIGLLKPDQGRVFVLDKELTNADKDTIDKVREKIGYVFQNGALLNSLTVYENVALPLREHEKLTEDKIKQRVEDVLEDVGLREHMQKTPAELSGGMRKRASLARALVRHADVLLYDEPTTGLDPIRSNEINKLILSEKRRRGVTSVVVMHDMPSVWLISDRVALLRGGKIYAIGKPEEFKDSTDPIVKQFINGETEGPFYNDAIRNSGFNIK